MSLPVDFVIKYLLSILIYSIIIVIFADPKILAILLINFGFSIAAELIQILSAPALNIRLTSSIVLMPPPTEIGMNIFLAVSEIKLLRLFVPYKVATLSI